MQIGLAFPTIVTGKIGGGLLLNKEEKSAIVVGIRSWPLHFYTELSLPERPKGQFIISFEAGSALIGEPDLEEMSAFSTMILNMGYRWNIGKN